ncbi:MAG TPA: sigma-E processing peptidase SpoIIGA [Candidatus Gallacutalibacter stercoravium]|nr:sigma-E processing peptidase SpoIIGA [Candidatus Gallacutalibacter stercoravium]
MTQIIYVDVLLAVNLFVNYFILLGSARFLNLHTPRRRLLLGAALGAVYSLSILLPQNALLSLLLKLVMATTITLAAFGWHGKKVFLKEAGCFLVISFSFGGILFALWYIAAPPGLLVHNGVVYFEISPIFLAGATIVCYLLLRVLHRLVQRPAPKSLYCHVEVAADGAVCSFQAKVDTGNSLVEPFSQLPVLVAEYPCVKAVIPQAARAFFESGGMQGEKLPEIWQKKIRMAPFHSVAGGGVLPCFLPEEMIVYQQNRAHKAQGYVAVCPPKQLGEHPALLNPALLEG